jgi:hypothetical protein
MWQPEFSYTTGGRIKWDNYLNTVWQFAVSLNLSLCLCLSNSTSGNRSYKNDCLVFPKVCTRMLITTLFRMDKTETTQMPTTRKPDEQSEVCLCNEILHSQKKEGGKPLSHTRVRLDFTHIMLAEDTQL